MTGESVAQAEWEQLRNYGRKRAVLPKALPPNGVGEDSVNMSPQGDRNRGPAKRAKEPLNLDLRSFETNSG